jgi:hypothetical protein
MIAWADMFKPLVRHRRGARARVHRDRPLITHVNGRVMVQTTTFMPEPL